MRIEEGDALIVVDVGVPENQFEFEDCIGILTGMIPMETFKEVNRSNANTAT